MRFRFEKSLAAGGSIQAPQHTSMTEQRWEAPALANLIPLAIVRKHQSDLLKASFVKVNRFARSHAIHATTNKLLQIQALEFPDFRYMVKPATQQTGARLSPALPQFDHHDNALAETFGAS